MSPCCICRPQSGGELLVAHAARGWSQLTCSCAADLQPCSMQADLLYQDGHIVARGRPALSWLQVMVWMIICQCLPAPGHVQEQLKLYSSPDCDCYE